MGNESRYRNWATMSSFSLVLSAPSEVEEQIGATSPLFDPLRARSVLFSDSTVRASTRHEGDKVVLSYASLKTHVRQRVVLPYTISQVDAIFHRGRYLVLLGRATNSVASVAIVDLHVAKLSVEFPCYKPTVSADGSFISYVRFFPREQACSGSAQYALLRVEAMGAADSFRAKTESAGKIFYPMGEGWSTPNIGIPHERQHLFASHRFFYRSDNNQMVFADRVDDALKVIWVSGLKEQTLTVREWTVPGERVYPVEQKTTCCCELSDIVWDAGEGLASFVFRAEEKPQSVLEVPWSAFA